MDYKVDFCDEANEIISELTKEKVKLIKEKINRISMHIERIKAVWKGEEEPTRCGNCNYCRSTKEIKKTVHYSEFTI